MASKRKAKSIEEILLSKPFPKLQFTSTEAKAIANIQRTLVDKQWKSDIDDLTTRFLKPGLEILKAVRKAGEGSPLARAEQMIGAKARVPTHRNIPLPPQLPISPLMLCLSPPYGGGYPSPANIYCRDPYNQASVSEFADKQRGIISLGVRAGIQNPTQTPCNRAGFSVGFDAFEANIAIGLLGHTLFFPAPLTEPGILWVTIDVTFGDPRFPSEYPIGMWAGNGLVGVFGSIYLTLYGLAYESARIRGQTFLWGLDSPVSNTGTFVSEPFSISESLIMRAGATNIQIGVEARVIAFRDALAVVGGDFAGAELQDPAPRPANEGPLPYIWQHYRSGPINIPRMCLTFFPRGLPPPGGSR